ncbi:MAG TPA: N-acetylmuramoyl-L-alanine amidase [Brumimicrobium sp.]|nr:N-acetylmuramoyl-L-alanine amidase [Brumimicrobium sp.]
MKTSSLLLLFLVPFFIWGQTLPFNLAYQAHPNVPKGVLETVSWTRTHMQNIDETYAPSCTGIPRPYGVMGVFDDGADYFKENGNLIAQLSSISVAQQKSNVAQQIKAYAAAFENIYMTKSHLPESKRIYDVLIELSEIPDSGRINLYARDAQVFEIMRYLNDADFAQTHGFLKYKLNLTQVFGEDNLEVLSASQVNFTQSGIETESGVSYLPTGGNSNKSIGYGPALWVTTPSCNYNSRGGTVVQAITIHTIQGSYSSAISWAQNCSANVSYHYVLRSSDGQVTQMLEEVERGWHVGNSNSIAIGFEHEGWVSQSTWYTNAMYQSSASLSRHITTKNHDASLKPVRTYYGASSTGINTLGACTRIKGHQHFPSQSHTDPGIHWNWEKYYKLVNGTPNITSITNLSGIFYDTGGASGNYGNDERKLWLFEPTGAGSVTLTFTSFNLEANWDYMFIYDGANTNAPLIGKYTGTSGPGSVTSNSGTLLVEFRSDCATVNPGWVASYSSVPNTPPTPPDNIAPSTLINIPSGWKTQTFQANFTDTDDTGGSGVEKALYHVGYLANGKWTANHNRGFIFDGFDGATLNQNWTVEAGSWGLNNGKLVQTDASLHNNNVYMPLKQDLANNYLYHWKGKFGGTVGNRRGGLYILCSDPTGIERGDSYFVWFRVDDNKVQFYKVSNNSFGSPLINVSHTINANTEYDFKLSFDRVSGKMQVYINDLLIGSYIDPNPISSGTHVSFRSGNATMEVDDFTVYRSRYPSTDIHVGSTITDDIRMENPNPSTSSGRIMSVIKDNAYNISAIQTKMVDVDWTVPVDLDVNDGVSTDIDTIYQTTLEGNWGAANDPNSGIVDYQVAIGTSSGGDEVMAWSSNGVNAAVSHLLTSPVYNQLYYISVKAENGAGLVATSSSDGQRYVDGNLAVTGFDLTQIVIFPNPAKDKVVFQDLKTESTVVIYDMKGQIVFEALVSPSENQIDISGFAQGTYNVVIKLNNQIVVKKLIKQ